MLADGCEDTDCRGAFGFCKLFLLHTVQDGVGAVCLTVC